MKKISVCRAGLAFVAVLLHTGCGKKEEKVAPPMPPPAPPVVAVTKPVPEAAPVFTAIATLDGSTSTGIHALVSGYLIKQAYQEGSVVKPGDLLFLINTKPFQPTPTGPANTNPARAKMTATIGGVAGKAIPGVGDMISPGMTLTTISTVDPIRAAFALPRKIDPDNPEQIAQASFELLLADGTPYPHKGKFDHIERPIQAATGAITVYVLFSNPDLVLRPGEYANVRVTPSGH
jgi:multidrug efflux pump subunit AcrA (membrane-fusion protein)